MKIRADSYGSPKKVLPEAVLFRVFPALLTNTAFFSLRNSFGVSMRLICAPGLPFCARVLTLHIGSLPRTLGEISIDQTPSRAKPRLIGLRPVIPFAFCLLLARCFASFAVFSPHFPPPPLRPLCCFPPFRFLTSFARGKTTPPFFSPLWPSERNQRKAKKRKRDHRKQKRPNDPDSTRCIFLNLFPGGEKKTPFFVSPWPSERNQGKASISEGKREKQTRPNNQYVYAFHFF